MYKHPYLKDKDLAGIPWMVAFALRDAGAADVKACRVLEKVMDELIKAYNGAPLPDKVMNVLERMQKEYEGAKGNSWYLRQDIIWHKPNPMPESVTDRCTKSHEYIFLLTKSAKYYYNADAIKTPMVESSLKRISQDVENQVGSERVPGKTNGNMKAHRPNGITRDRLLDYNSKEKQLRTLVKRGGYDKEADIPLPEAFANKKSVWTVTTRPFKEAHFATFPEKLIEDCIKAGSPENGLVLDPFSGSGTTSIVAKKLHKNFTAFELNPAYIHMSAGRRHKEFGLFNQ